jgi:two-component system, cell cycle sensor histidine kinase and response regulator CckA
VTYSDITEKAKAEETTRQSEEKYRALIDNMQDGVFINQDGVLQFANDAMANMLGYTAEEMIGKAIDTFVAPENRDTIRNDHQQRIAFRDVEHEYEMRLCHRDGVTSIIASINVALFTYRDKPATIGTVKDITERKRAEQEEIKLEAQLQRSQKMEAIGTLAGGVAHDLNNILSGIVSYPELLLMDLPSQSHLRKPIQIIQQSGEKAAAIVQDLLTLARRGVAITKVVNLNQIITDFLKSHEFDRLSSFHTKVHVEVNLAPDLFNINASPIHISKTIMNLISNAAEAMPEGGKIMITTANKYVDQPIRGYDEVLEGNYTTLIVSDTGVGISHNDLEKIFEPFYTKKVMGRSGTGLGMAVVWGTVKDHNGYIDVLSAEKRGTTFTLYFQTTVEALRQELMDLPLEDYKGQGETILVVDDMAEQREIAAAMLTRLGYNVATVAGGEEALSYLKSQPADLLILDMIMDPGIDGLETYRRILKIRPNQKAVVASGYSLSQRVKEIQKLGAAIYLKKPYSIEKLGMAVRSELEK